MSSVWGMIRQWGSTIKVSIELPVATRHRRDMTEKLLKATLNPNNQQQQQSFKIIVEVMHQSFVITARHPPRGIAVLMCGAVIFWVPPQCRVSAGLVILRKYTPIEFTIIKSGAMTLSRSPQCRAFSRAVMDEKSLPPLFTVGGEGLWLQMTCA